MNVASVTAVLLVQDAGGPRAQIEAALALGASPRQSAADIIRRSVRLAMAPVIDSTKTVGIVSLPGAMTGMILAGADPLQKVRLQVVVVFMLLVAASTTVTLVSRPAACAAFAPYAEGAGYLSALCSCRRPATAVASEEGEEPLGPPPSFGCRDDLAVGPPSYGWSSRQVLPTCFTERTTGRLRLAMTLAL